MSTKERVLKPKAVTLHSSFKAFGFRDGISTGTEISVSFEVDGEPTEAQLKEAIVREQFVLDTLAMRLERGKKSFPAEIYNDIHQNAKLNAQELIYAYRNES